MRVERGMASRYKPGLLTRDCCASTALGSSAGRQQRANHDDRTLGFRSSQSAWGRPEQKTRLDVSSPSTTVRGLSWPVVVKIFRVSYRSRRFTNTIVRFIVPHGNVVFAIHARYMLPPRNIIAMRLCGLLLITGCCTWTFDLRFNYRLHSSEYCLTYRYAQILITP